MRVQGLGVQDLGVNWLGFGFEGISCASPGRRGHWPREAQSVCCVTRPEAAGRGQSPGRRLKNLLALAELARRCSSRSSVLWMASSKHHRCHIARNCFTLPALKTHESEPGVSWKRVCGREWGSILLQRLMSNFIPRIGTNCGVCGPIADATGASAVSRCLRLIVALGWGILSCTILYHIIVQYTMLHDIILTDIVCHGVHTTSLYITC